METPGTLGLSTSLLVQMSHQLSPPNHSQVQQSQDKNESQGKGRVSIALDQADYF